MKNRKVILIALGIILLLTVIIIIALFIKKIKSDNDQIGLDSSNFEWSEIFDKSNKEITKEEKDKMYIESLESTLEKAILDTFEELKSTSVVIDRTDKVTDVTITLDINLETQFDKKDTDEIYNLVLNSIGDSTKENIRILNQNGEIIN